MSDGVAGDIAMMTALYEDDLAQPDAFRRQAEIAMTTMRLSVDFRPGETLPTARRSSFFRTLDRTLQRALSGQLEQNFWFDTTRYPNYVDIRVEVDGGILRFIALLARVLATTGSIFLLWLTCAAPVLTPLPVVFIPNPAQPLRRLAAAS